MPLYEYHCEACGRRFELIRKFSDPPLEACTVCGQGPVRRLQSSPAIQFKGSGWYITDYAQKGKSATPPSGEGGKAAAPDTGEGAAKSEKPAKTDAASSTGGTSSAASSPSSTPGS